MASFPDCIQFQVQGYVVESSGYRRPVWNVYTYRIPPACYTAAHRLSFTNDFASAITNQLNAAFSVEYRGVMIWAWYPTLTGDKPVPMYPPANGSILGDRLPLHQCVYVRLLTAERGKSFIGSKRLAPVAVSEVTKDELNAGGVFQWGQGILNFARTLVTVTPIAGLSFTPIVWSRLLSPSPSSTVPVVGADITSAMFDKTICVWRHRRERMEVLPVFHGATVQGFGSQSVPDSSLTAVSNLTSVVTDTDGYFVGGTFKIPPGLGGTYQITLGLQWGTPTVSTFYDTDISGPLLQFDGTGEFDSTGIAPTVQCFATMRLAAGDVVQLNAFHSGSGVAETITQSVATIAFLGS
jgi:hypothetical protein